MIQKNLINIILLILLATSSCSLLQTLNFSRKEPFILGGIQVNEPDHEKWIDTLKYIGMNTVPVTVYAKQGDWNSDNLWYEKTNQYVINEIRTAKKRGLKIILILRVALDHAFPNNQFLWHGMIMPGSDDELDLWFKKYTKFVLKWATIAENEKVDIFGIGNEMNALSATIPVEQIPPNISYYKELYNLESQKNKLLEFSDLISRTELWNDRWSNYNSINEYLSARITKHNQWAKQMAFADTKNCIDLINTRRELLNYHWLELIANTRKHFSGKLIYAANFDNFQEVGFWHELDFIGINAYFPLRDYNETPNSNNLSEILSDGWNQVFEKIVTFRINNNLESKPIIFTELGYTYKNNSTIEPWNSKGFSLIENEVSGQLIIWEDEPINYEERALAIKTLNETNIKFGNMLKGLLYWKFSSFKSHTEIEPFLIYIGKDSTDPAIKELRRF